MKGYSFQELVKLAEAAVKRAGDTMTGSLTTPKVLVSSAQGTEVNALTRKDYVDAAVNTKASNRVNFATGLGTSRSITGATIPTHAGVWTVSNSTWTPVAYGSLLVTTNRSDELTSTGTGSYIHYLFISHNSARIYSATNVNGGFSGWRLADADSVNKSGDTMTGNLTAPTVLVSSAQNTSANALTRKDYVDTAISDGLRSLAITADSSLPANGKYPSHLRFMNPAVVTLDGTWPDGSRLGVIVDHGVNMAAGDCIVQLTSGTISTNIGADRQIRLRQASREFIFEKIAGQWRVS